MLKVDPFERPTAEQALRHPWLQSVSTHVNPLVSTPKLDNTSSVSSSAVTSRAITPATLAPPVEVPVLGRGLNLLPRIRENFNARRTFKSAVDVIRLANRLGHDFRPDDEQVLGTGMNGEPRYSEKSSGSL